VEVEFGRVDSLVNDESGSSGEAMRSKAFGRAASKWLLAVRKISSAAAFRKELESRLVKANAALMRMFQVRGARWRKEHGEEGRREGTSSCLGSLKKSK
jgi:hypothetical protein